MLDTNLQTEITGLYVCDASTFPEALARPPRGYAADHPAFAPLVAAFAPILQSDGLAVREKGAVPLPGVG